MNRVKLISVVTSIQPPTAAMQGLCRVLRRVSAPLLVIGDRKGPQNYPVAGAELWTLHRQRKLPLKLPARLPIDHYTRKNVGYLVAISRRAECIYETDDDNRPLPDWMPRSQKVRARMMTRPQWCNIYRWFTRSLIWPRGLPLDEILRPAQRPGAARPVKSPIQQGLADGSPDVDAIWRLVLDAPLKFDRQPAVGLARGSWCPFNSQSTWWWPEAYPLLYLPSYCTFRMTDIWRSLVAQRCLWEINGCVTFHAGEVVQKRNPHNLMRDFRDEVPGYLSNDSIRRVLEGLRLKSGPAFVGANLERCYEALAEAGIFPRKELTLVRTWLHDLEQFAGGLEL